MGTALYEQPLCAAHCLETAILAEKAFLDGVRIVTSAIMNSDCIMPH